MFGDVFFNRCNNYFLFLINFIIIAKEKKGGGGGANHINKGKKNPIPQTTVTHGNDSNEDFYRPFREL
jgi:hypothetical protein